MSFLLTLRGLMLSGIVMILGSAWLQEHHEGFLSGLLMIAYFGLIFFRTKLKVIDPSQAAGDAQRDMFAVALICGCAIFGIVVIVPALRMMHAG